MATKAAVSAGIAAYLPKLGSLTVAKEVWSTYSGLLGTGLHSSTIQLNVSACHGIRGAA